MAKLIHILYLLIITLLLIVVSYLVVSSNTFKKEISDLKTINTSVSKKSTPAEDPQIVKKSALLFDQTTQLINQQDVLLSSTINNLLENSQFSGSALAVRKGQVVLAAGYGPTYRDSGQTNSFNSIYYIASAQKVITATLLMTLVEEGKISLTDTLETFFGDIIPDATNITLDDLLSMTSGLTLKKNSAVFKNEEDYFRYVLHNVTQEKTDHWTYSSVNYTLLTIIIEKVSGMSYQNFFQKKIANHLSLPHTGFSNDPTLLGLVSQDFGERNKKNIAYISEDALIKDTGTGNMMMDVSDFYYFYKCLIDGQIIQLDSLKKMWQITDTPYPHTYKSGAYHRTDNTLYAHGFLRGYEPTMILSNDGQNGIILLSNHAKKEINGPLAENIFQAILNN